MCCIDSFCKQVPKTDKQLEAIGVLNSGGLDGCVPCEKCAQKIITGKWVYALELEASWLGEWDLTVALDY